MNSKDLEKRGEFFLRRKGLGRVVDRYKRATADLVNKLEQNGESQELLHQWMNAEKRRVNASHNGLQLDNPFDGMLHRDTRGKAAQYMMEEEHITSVAEPAYQKAVNNGEFETKKFKQDFENHLEQELTKKTQSLETTVHAIDVEGAKDTYLDNPTRENEMKFVQRALNLDKSNPAERYTEQRKRSQESFEKGLRHHTSKELEKVAQAEADKIRFLRNKNKIDEEKENAVKNDLRLAMKIRPKVAKSDSLSDQIHKRAQELANEE